MTLLEAPKHFWKCLQNARLNLWCDVDLFLRPLYIFTPSPTPRVYEVAEPFARPALATRRRDAPAKMYFFCSNGCRAAEVFEKQISSTILVKAFAAPCSTRVHNVRGHTQVTAQARLQRKAWSRFRALLRCQRVFAPKRWRSPAPKQLERESAENARGPSGQSVQIGVDA